MFFHSYTCTFKTKTLFLHETLEHIGRTVGINVNRADSVLVLIRIAMLVPIILRQLIDHKTFLKNIDIFFLIYHILRSCLQYKLKLELKNF
jgi:hypothetical protein